MSQRSRHWSTVLCEDETHIPYSASSRTSRTHHHLNHNTPSMSSSVSGEDMACNTYEAATVLVALHDRMPAENNNNIHNIARNRNTSMPRRSPHLSASTFSCESCDRSFKRKGDLKRHVRRVHHKIRDSICPICCKAFGEDYNMRRHVNRVHMHRIP